MQPEPTHQQPNQLDPAPTSPFISPQPSPTKEFWVYSRKKSQQEREHHSCSRTNQDTNPNILLSDSVEKLGKSLDSTTTNESIDWPIAL